MSDEQPTGQELSALWVKRLESAKVRLDFARNYVLEVGRDLKSGATPPADGRDAYKHALRAEHLALAHYRRVLSTLSVLRLTGKIPEAQGRGAKGASGGGSGEGSE